MLVHLNLADTTSQAHLDGTTTGIIVTIVVMIPALAFFIGLIYWSARDSGAKKGQLQPATSLGSAGAAQQPVTVGSARATERPLANADGHAASSLLVDHVGHAEEAPSS
jgi:hypothetical protein